MTDKELIQALRWCGGGKFDCTGCPGEENCDAFSGCGKTVLDAADRMEALLAENEHLREATKMMPRWISVDERLPEENRCVVARDMVGVVTTAYYNGSWHGMLNCDAVTHWMPLPSTEGVE